MKAEIIAVGTEILLGEIVNTNAQYISKRLADLGIFVYHQTVVGDNPKRVKETYEEGFQRAELLIATGGLGPTQDDLTKEIAAEYFQKDLLIDETSLQKIYDYFQIRGLTITEGNKKQALIPEGAKVLPNHHGTAPGCVLEDKGKILVLLPGPPHEMIPMFEQYVVPYLQSFQEEILVSRVLRIAGIGESFVEEKIKDLIKNQTNPTLAPYATQGEVRLRITARSTTEEEGFQLIRPMEEEIRKRLGFHVYGIDGTSLEQEVVQLLQKKQWTISIAESCTGGMVASRLINYPGVSSTFMEGFVTYSNEAKIKRLGVSKQTLEEEGAVSAETAKQMAIGAAKMANTYIGIGITGIAGPSGGTPEKPVGLVYIGLCQGDKVQVKKLQLSGDRETVRKRVTLETLDWLRRILLKNRVDER
ncbi:MAG: competence/damage-inducible protein A [Epulopiscium sp.]|nr:competence/damage-inducible protein A [Candidatus Epulonipiscium sp.]